MNENQNKSLSKTKTIFLILISLLIVAFGQPATSLSLGVLAGCFGYACFWRVLLQFKSSKKRFILSTLWFTAVQLIQLSWMTAHPFLYIYAPYLLFSLLQGLQFGVIGLFITPAEVTKLRSAFAIAGLWVLMEWSRLFFLSGYSWNPAGMALGGNIYAMQMASVFGIYGLSFLVIFVNVICLKCLMDLELNKKIARSLSLFFLMAFLPYVYGYIQLQVQGDKLSKTEDFFTALLVQPSFAVDETDHIRDRKVLVAHVMDQWKKMLNITERHKAEKIDLIVLPEYVVPFGTYTTIFPQESVKDIFAGVFDEKELSKLPPLDDHLAEAFKRAQKEGSDITFTFVNNAYWLQAFANMFNAPIIAGLEDVDDISLNERNYYSAALYFTPASINCPIPERYEKRVLVPLGEYIPFSFCRQLAVNYGVTGSFTKGQKAKVFTHPKKNFGVSICYEETFGHVMRENRLGGAELLVNMTNDGWFPNSKLTKQHFDHARLRTVECGIPLIRACNTGITAGFDSLGRVVDILENKDKTHESITDSLLIKIPTYSYHTIYSRFGDHLILALSFFSLLGLLPLRRPKD